MTREKAMEILLLHRGDAMTSDDPQVSEALRMAAADAELGLWLRQNRSFHEAVKKEFDSIEPPPGLKERILAGRAANREHPTWLWRPAVWAAAAAIAILIAAGSFWTQRNPEDAQTYANFHSRMTSFALRTYQMDIVTNNTAAVRSYLAQNGAPADFPLTPGLAQLPVKGGGRLSWQNQPVAMMCFSLTNNETAFMFVIDRTAVENHVPARDITSSSSLSSVSWTNAGRIYLLAATERPETLAALAAP